MGANEISKHADAFLICEVDHFDAVLAQPVYTTAKILRFTHNDCADAKLPDQSAAIPAGRKRRDHDFVAIHALAACPPERIGFRMHRRIILLHAQVVSTPEEIAAGIEKRRADGNAAFSKADARFLEGDAEKRGSFSVVHASRF